MAIINRLLKTSSNLVQNQILQYGQLESDYLKQPVFKKKTKMSFFGLLDLQ